MSKLDAVLAAAIVLVLPSAFGQDGERALGNWFNDPFSQVRDSVADCPTPLGPRITRAQARQQEHYRVERGTSCYLSGECNKASAYAYDADIAAAVIALFAADQALLARSSIWITVSRRFVYVEGCSSESEDLIRLEPVLRGLPDVQTVLFNIASDASGHIPYQVQPRPDTPPG